MKTFIVVVLIAMLAALAQSCRYDSDCGLNYRCVNNQCFQLAECTRHLDCLKHGLYWECDKNNRCVTSNHKICRSNDDCKKNMINKKCKNDRCTT